VKRKKDRDVARMSLSCERADKGNMEFTGICILFFRLDESSFFPFPFPCRKETSPTQSNATNLQRRNLTSTSS
jgi:hypothetical protein